MSRIDARLEGLRPVAWMKIAWDLVRLAEFFARRQDSVIVRFLARLHPIYQRMQYGRILGNAEDAVLAFVGEKLHQVVRGSRALECLPVSRFVLYEGGRIIDGVHRQDRHRHLAAEVAVITELPHCMPIRTISVHAAVQRPIIRRTVVENTSIGKRIAPAQ